MQFRAPDYINRFDDEIEVVTINRRTGAKSVSTEKAPEKREKPATGSFTAKKAESLAKARAASAAKAKERKAAAEAPEENTAA